MLQNLSKLVVEIDEKKFELHVSNESQWGHVHAALQQMMSYVMDQMNQAHKASLPQEKNCEAPIIEVPIE